MDNSKFELLRKRAERCKSHYDSLRINRPTLAHECNKSSSAVMWGYWRVKGWGHNITDESNQEWEKTIERHEKRLEKIASDGFLMSGGNKVEIC